MKTPKHNFPEGKAVICNEKITLKNYKKLFSKCLKANIRIGELFMRKPICKDYIYFGWDGYKICRYYKDNDSPKVSIGEFNSFFNHKEPKEKTYKITKEQILKYNMKDEFPEVFDSFFTIGKWYKKTWKDGDVDLFPVYEIVQNGNILDKGNYFRNGELLNKADSYGNISCLTDSRVVITEATEQEVTEALTKEAVKRGLKEGVYMVDIYNGESEKDTVQVSSNIFQWEPIGAGINAGQMALRDSDGNIIFHNGKFAELIKPLTIQEAEAKLKEIGVNAKIV